MKYITRNVASLTRNRHLLFLALLLPCLGANSHAGKALSEGECAKKLLRTVAPELSLERAEIKKDYVFWESLVPGQKITLKPSAFVSLPSIKKTLSKPIEVEVVKILPELFGRTRWKDNGAQIVIRSPETGTVAINSDFVLAFGEFPQSPYPGSSFIPGEYVEVDVQGSDELIAQVVNRDDIGMQTLRFARDSNVLPFMATFEKFEDSTHSIVRFRTRNWSGEGITLRVPNRWIKLMRTGTNPTLMARLKLLRQFSPTFEDGEPVRYRARDHQIREGIYGETVKPGRQYTIYKKVNSERGFTPSFEVSWNDMIFDFWNPSMNAILDAAAKLESRPEFLALSPVDQVAALTLFVEKNMPWQACANVTGQQHGPDHFSELLVAGAGVCRHNSILLGTILTEAGFRVRSVVHTYPVTPVREDGLQTQGHAWLEVDVPSPAADSFVTHILDPSSSHPRLGGTFTVMPLWDVEKIAAKNPNSMCARWYTQAERIFTFPK